jgi:hypothetical protein
MKKPKSLIDAEADLAAKAAELDAARESVKRIEAELRAAYVVLSREQQNADSKLPQCKMVRVGYGGKEEDCGLMVIKTKTPTGMLSVRHFGQEDRGMSKFKWDRHFGKFVEARKRDSFSSYRYELRDVPSEYMPSKKDQAVYLTTAEMIK